MLYHWATGTRVNVEQTKENTFLNSNFCMGNDTTDMKSTKEMDDYADAAVQREL